MATLTIQIVSAAGTSSKTLTFSGPDAQRIFTAYQNQVEPGATQDQFAAFLAQQAKKLIGQLVLSNESVTPTVPVMT